jgi:PAS domain S-box-containing protein
MEKPNSFERRIPIIAIISLSMVLALGIYSFYNLQQIINTSRMLSHTMRIQSHSEQVLKLVIDIETGQRGYVITLDSVFLKPLFSSMEEISSRLYTLDSLTSNSHLQHDRVDSIRTFTNRFKTWSEMIIEARNNSFEEARQLVSTRNGIELTDIIRDLVEAVQKHARLEFNDKNRITRNSLTNFQFSLLGFVATMLALIIYLFITISKTLRARNLIEDKLHTSIEYVKDLYNRAPCGYLSVDQDITVTNINDTLLHWLGYTQQEVIGIMKYDDLLSDTSREAFHQSFDQDFVNYKEKGYVHNLEFEFKRKNGSTFPVMVNSTAFFNEQGEFSMSRTSVFDDTERKQAERKFSNILESTPDGLVIIDQQGIIQIVNKQTEKLFGYTRKELLGQSIDMLVPVRSVHLHKGHVKNYFSRPHARPMGEGLDLFARKKSGEEFPVEISLSPIDHIKETLVAAAIRDITQRKQTEELLREKDERFRSVFTSTHDAIIIMSDEGTVMAWNKGAEQIFGWTEGEMMGKPMTLVMPEKYKARHIDCMERFKQTQQTTIIGKTIEAEGLKKDGGIFPLELSIGASKMKGQHYFCGIMRDISERRLTEKLEREMAAIVEHSEDAIVSTTSNGEIYSWNQAAEKLYGYSAHEVQNRSLSIIFPEHLKEEDQQIIEKVSTGNSIHNYETERIRKDGALIHVSITVSPIKDKSGNVIGTSRISRDITAQKQRIQEIMDLNAELDAFTYSVSHDLRAPLRSIAGYTRILQEDYVPQMGEEGMRIATIIARNTNRMGTLIDDLLNFSRLGRRELNTSLVNMKLLVERILVDHFTDQQVRFDIRPLHTVLADMSMVEIVWINLISNAIKYSAKQPESIVELGSFQEGNEICFYVRDNGVGFDMRYYDKLFGVFQRLHKMEEFEGTGVGLALVKKIVQRHHGRVWAEAQVNNGATFHFTIPLENKVKEKFETNTL